MKKILFCDNAGYSNYTHKLCNALVELENAPEVVYLTDALNHDLEQVDKRVKVIDKVAAYNPNCKRGTVGWFFDRLLLPFKIISTRNKYIKEEKADTVFLQATLPIFDQFLLKKLKKYSKIVLTVHNVIPHEKNVFWSNKSLRKTYEIADHLVVHTNVNVKELNEIFGIPKEKVSVINHGTDIEFNQLDYNDCRKQVGINDDKPALLIYGGIRDYKGLDVLIPALKGLDCRLIIAGAMQTGLTFDKFDKQIKDCGIDAICFIERVSEEFTDVLFQACDFVVFPYKDFHSQSGVFMQAIKYGKRVIATDVGAFKEFVDNYNFGYICKPNDVEDLSDCIKNAIKDTGYSTEEILNISKQFSWSTSAQDYLEVSNGK